MARYTGPVCKQCRRGDGNIFLKGERCFTEKCRSPDYVARILRASTTRRASSCSEYAIRLREKQKVRRIYGVVERQSSTTSTPRAAPARVSRCSACSVALRQRRAPPRVRLHALPGAPALRQHLLVNGKRVDIPSVIMRAGDKVEVRQKSREIRKLMRRSQVEKRPMLSLAPG